jgi:succinyl-CoA synthetase alpha subunit
MRRQQWLSREPQARRANSAVGATWSELLPLFERDPETRMLALSGEIGTTNEEDAAALIFRRLGSCTQKFR